MYVERMVPCPNLASYLPLEASTQAFGGEGFDSQMKEPGGDRRPSPGSSHEHGVHRAPRPGENGRRRKRPGIYVKNYKQYNIPGVVTMSFSIDAGGVPCIHGENEILKAMCDEGEG